MMDFLRRLAPLRETDPSRAVAVLPSRFASESPLRMTIAQARPARRVDDDEASLSYDTSAAPAPISALAPQRRPVTGAQSAQAAPRALAHEPARRDNGNPTSTQAPPGAELPDIAAADPRAFQDRRGVPSERAAPAGPELQSVVAALPASHALQSASESLGQPRVAAPLSQATLAQRTLKARDESPVVHVTIGRIDVVANAAPAPAMRRSPRPRQGTVTLADYLRGGNGSRR